MSRCAQRLILAVVALAACVPVDADGPGEIIELPSPDGKEDSLFGLRYRLQASGEQAYLGFRSSFDGTTDVKQDADLVTFQATTLNLVSADPFTATVSGSWNAVPAFIVEVRPRGASQWQMLQSVHEGKPTPYFKKMTIDPLRRTISGEVWVADSYWATWGIGASTRPTAEGTFDYPGAELRAFVLPIAIFARASDRYDGRSTQYEAFTYGFKLEDPRGSTPPTPPPPTPPPPTGGGSTGGGYQSPPSPEAP